MLEARRMYRNAIIAGRVKTVTVKDPGTNANLDDPRFDEPPPLSPSSSSSGSSPRGGRVGPSGPSGNGGAGSSGGGGGNESSGNSTVTPRDSTAPSTLFTIYHKYNPSSTTSQPTASSSTRAAPLSNTITAVGSTSIGTRGVTTKPKAEIIQGGGDVVSPPTVGTVQNALDNLSVSPERRRRGNAAESGEIEASASSKHARRSSARSGHSGHSGHSSRSDHSRSIRSSPPTDVTQYEDGSSISSRRSSSIASPVVRLPTRHAHGPRSTESPSVSSGDRKSSRSKHSSRASRLAMMEMIENSWNRSSSISDPTARRDNDMRSSRSSSHKQKRSSRSRVERIEDTESGSTRDRDSLHRRTHRSTKSSSSVSSPPRNDPDWSPQTNVTYYEPSSHPGSPLAACVSVGSRQANEVDRAEREDREDDDEGFTTAPSSPDLQPATPPLADEIDEPIIQSSSRASHSSLIASTMDGWDRENDRAHLIPRTHYAGSRKQHTSTHTQQTTYVPRRTYSETGIQTETDLQDPDHSVCANCQSHRSEAVAGEDTVPATPIQQSASLPPPIHDRGLEFAGGLGALGLTTVSLPNISHQPMLDPRSPVTRTTSLPAK